MLFIIPQLKYSRKVAPIRYISCFLPLSSCRVQKLAHALLVFDVQHAVAARGRVRACARSDRSHPLNARVCALRPELATATGLAPL